MQLRQCILSLSFFASISIPSYASALPFSIVECPNCASVETQAAQLAKEAQMVVKQIEQYKTQVMQYQQQLRDAKNLKNHFSGDISNDLLELTSITNRIEALNSSNETTERMFDHTFKTYSEYLTDDFSPTDKRKEWSQQALETNHAVIKTTNALASQMDRDNKRLENLSKQNQEDLGHEQSLELSNDINLELIAEIRKLRMANLILMKQNAIQQQRKEDQASVQDAWFMKNVNNLSQ